MIRTRLAWRRAASSIPLSTYSAITGSISSPMRSSMTCAEPFAGMDCGVPCPCARGVSSGDQNRRRHNDRSQGSGMLYKRRRRRTEYACAALTGDLHCLCSCGEPAEAAAGSATSPVDLRRERSKFLDTRARRTSPAGSCGPDWTARPPASGASARIAAASEPRPRDSSVEISSARASLSSGASFLARSSGVTAAAGCFAASFAMPRFTQ